MQTQVNTVWFKSIKKNDFSAFMTNQNQAVHAQLEYDASLNMLNVIPFDLKVYFGNSFKNCYWLYSKDFPVQSLCN